MTELLTAAQMRAIEQAAIDSGEVTGLELMERAGCGVVEAIFEEWPELATSEETGQGGAAPHPSDAPRGISDKKKRAVVLCGPGNNGGDGFVVARLLHERGWAVEVFLYGDAEKLPPDARVNYERWAELGVVDSLKPGILSAAIERAQLHADWDYDEELNTEVRRGATTVYVDALFGTGLTRSFTEELLEICQEWFDHGYEHGIAIDIQSGLCADSGRDVGGTWINSKLVVSFERPKIGQFLGASHYDVEKLHVVDLDIEWPDGMFYETVKSVEEIDLELDQNGWFENGLQKSQRTHKYTHGHALILSGGFGKTGAARLAGRGALRIGAGLVTLGVPPSARMEVASHITAIMQTRVSEGQELAALLQDTRLNALCLGPGMGVERARELVPVALLAKRATVLDADALTAFADDPQALFDQLHETCVLTPHGGEFARLFPDIAEKLNAPATKGPAYSKVDATRDAAARAGCVVLFKGPDTVIAAPDGQCSINSAHYERSAPWLATAGSGDVLAGFITGLLARGFSPMQAAQTAAWLHVECALAFGPGLIAEDLPEMLPNVFKQLEL